MAIKDLIQIQLVPIPLFPESFGFSGFLLAKPKTGAALSLHGEQLSGSRRLNAA